MISVPSSNSPALARRSLLRGLALLAFLCGLSTALLAQTDTTTNGGNGRMRRNQNGDTTGGGRGNFDPAQMQQQMLDRLREQFGVTDDAEWKVISDRLTPIMELRRANAGGFGFGGMRGGMNANTQDANAGGRRRGNVAASPEQDALRQAITDNLPDAEIKARLTRLRDVRKSNEEKLAKAQEDLRAILTVRQEAVAVMFGLLP